MKKVLVAMNNIGLMEQMKKSGKYIVYDYDIDSKENVVEFLKRQEIDVIITKDTLQGNMTNEEYIKNIRQVSEKIKIILCVKTINERYKGFLFANNVFDIIETDEIKFSDVFDMIDSKDKKIILKNANNIGNTKANSTTKLNVVTKQKICVFGTSGAGKSYVASVLAQITSKKFKLNTLLVDMDIQNAAIDIYNNLTNTGNNLQYVMEEIDRGAFNIEILQDIISTEKNKGGNLSFITNNMGIYECQNKLSEEYYSKLYNETESKYDVLLLDLPSAPFLDVVPYSLAKTDKVFFVVNPNFISMRQAIKYLDLITNIWKVPKENVNIIVNRIKKHSLSNRQIKSLLKDFDVCLEILENEELEGIINGIEELNISNVEKVDKIAKIFGIGVDSLK